MSGNIIYKTRELIDFRQTVAKVFEFASLYRYDLFPWLRVLNLPQWYDYVSNVLPYRPDPPKRERVHRPALTARPDWSGARDCDDKAVLILAFVELQNEVEEKERPIKTRLVVSGKAERAHHIYPELEFPGTPGLWTPYDATYPAPRCEIGKRLFEEGFREVYYPNR